MQNTELAKIVEEGIKEFGYDDLFLVNIAIKGSKVEIFLDSDEAVSFEKCHKLSRWIEAILDQNLAFGESYTLDVSSAGVGSPLKLLRQYAKNIGRTIEIKSLPDQLVKGVLLDVIGDIIIVEFERKTKVGKKTIKEIVQENIKFENIIESKIKINFN